MILHENGKTYRVYLRAHFSHLKTEVQLRRTIARALDHTRSIKGMMVLDYKPVLDLLFVYNIAASVKAVEDESFFRRAPVG